MGSLKDTLPEEGNVETPPRSDANELLVLNDNLDMLIRVIGDDIVEIGNKEEALIELQKEIDYTNNYLNRLMKVRNQIVDNVNY